MKKVIVIAFFVVCSTTLFSQTPPLPGGGGPDCNSSPWACIPIDGGASILIGLGLALGGKKAADLYKRK